MKIHPSAVIHPNAKIHASVEIGPFCIVGEHVELSEGVRLISHVCIEGYTKIGNNTVIYPFASLGFSPQDLKYNGEKSYLEIGSNNVIREYVTMHPGTQSDLLKTVVGNNCLFMIGAHIAHDCKVGNHVIMANNATLGGHVVVGDNAIIGGMSAVHQRVRIGKFAIIGGMSGIAEDVIPYGNAKGDRANLAGVNIIGMRRHGFNANEINEINEAFAFLFESEREDTINSRVQVAREKYVNNAAICDIINFIDSSGNRGFCLPRRKNHSK
jgi:UDP-N-acetylglucosamine acyltransferase